MPDIVRKTTRVFIGIDVHMRERRRRSERSSRSGRSGWRRRFPRGFGLRRFGLPRILRKSCGFERRRI
jgi:hypothetical protein